MWQFDRLTTSRVARRKRDADPRLAGAADTGWFLFIAFL
jgi:hypothetical protein